MLFRKSQTRRAHREGYKQGMLTALLISSPFIAAGIKWMFENADPLARRMRSMKETDLYAQLFDRETYKERQANRTLEQIRAGEGNYKDFDVEASSEEDAQLFSVIKELVKKEMKNQEANQGE